MAKGGSEPAGVGLEGQEVPGEYRDAVVAGTANPAHTGTRRASDRGLGESPLRGDAHGGFGGAGRGDGLPATAVPRPGSTLRWRVMRLAVHLLEPGLATSRVRPAAGLA